MHQWEPFFTAMGEDIGGAPPPPNNGLEIGYRSFSFNDKALGHGEPVRVREGEKLLFHLLNASATETVNVACAGHSFEVVALDGNPVPNPQTVSVVQVGPAERVDAIIAMNTPGVWIMGTTDEDDRKHGFGVVVEYANRKGTPQWRPPLHLHRHSFELTKLDGKGTAGILKDVVMVDPYKSVEVDFRADNPGDTLFHCHQQLHMDFGFMTLMKYK